MRISGERRLEENKIMGNIGVSDKGPLEINCLSLLFCLTERRRGHVG